MKCTAIACLLLLACLQSSAQQANHFNSWWILQGSYKVLNRTTVKPIYGWSRNNFVHNWQQSLLGAALDYEVRKKLTLGAGYEWIERFPYGEQPPPHQITIHRYFQSLGLKRQLGRLGLSHLLRFNQEGIDGNYRYFVIYQLGLKVPLHRKADTTKYALKLSEAIFINHGKGSYQSRLNQNRAFAGFSIAISSSVALDLGYLNHYVLKPDLRAENNHTLFVRLLHTLDVRSEQ